MKYTFVSPENILTSRDGEEMVKKALILEQQIKRNGPYSRMMYAGHIQKYIELITARTTELRISEAKKPKRLRKPIRNSDNHIHENFSRNSD